MLRITNGIICVGDKLVRGEDLYIEAGKIVSQPGGATPAKTLDAGGAYVLPGFIEIHTHGARLFEFTMGRYDPRKRAFIGDEEAYERGLPEWLAARASTGTTTLYAGTWAAPVEQICFVFERLRRHMASGENGRNGSFVPGGLLEGAFLNPDMCGAQNPDMVLDQRIDLFDEMNESGVIKLVNVVPDYGARSFELIRTLADRRISVGAGHLAATADAIREGADNGLKYIIHFLNGPTGHSYKIFDGGGAVEGILGDDRVFVEIICDGVHVNPRYVRDVISRKGQDKVMAVTDAMFGSQASGVRDFEINGIPGRISEDGRFAFVRDRKSLTLFSSIVTMDRAFSNLLCFLTREMEGIWIRRHEALGLETALPAAARMCATNIADMLGARGCEAPDTGSLEPGKWADVVLADIEGEPGEYSLRVKKVLVRGREVAGNQ
jgi:N-acetylglucosamine-6-phosphate deacetylase